jgi:hypothetical protein
MQKPIVKLESRVEVTPSGATRTVYRQRIYNPDHPEYPTILKERQASRDAELSKPLPLIRNEKTAELLY